MSYAAAPDAIKFTDQEEGVIGASTERQVGQS